MYHFRRIALDRSRKTSWRSAFIRARKSEDQYAARLRKIAQYIGDIVRGFDIDDLSHAPEIERALRRYAETLDPWAAAVGERMVTEVAARDRAAWRKVSEQIGRALHREIDSAPTGAVVRQLITEQVGLIKSLPLDAADRVQKLAIESLYQGRRAGEISAELFRTGEVTKSRADLIARTEVGRSATALTQARAQFVGSESYIWRTSKDARVRETHRHLEGKVFRWDDPPECDPGYHAHPGAIFNCRCYPEPILPQF